jgi:hypothetical protein
VKKSFDVLFQILWAFILLFFVLNSSARLRLEFIFDNWRIPRGSGHMAKSDHRLDLQPTMKLPKREIQITKGWCREISSNSTFGYLSLGTRVRGRQHEIAIPHNDLNILERPFKHSTPDFMPFRQLLSSKGQLLKPINCGYFRQVVLYNRTR